MYLYHVVVVELLKRLSKLERLTPNVKQTAFLKINNLTISHRQIKITITTETILLRLIVFKSALHEITLLIVILINNVLRKEIIIFYE